MNFKEFLGRNEQKPVQVNVIWSDDYVTEQVSKLTLGEYRDPEKFQFCLEHVLTELCHVYYTSKPAEEKRFEELIKKCTCKERLINIMKDFTIRAIQRYLCIFRGNSDKDRNIFSNILAALYVLISAFGEDYKFSYEDIINLVINHKYLYGNIPWSFRHFEVVFEYIKGRCYDNFYEVHIEDIISSIWKNNMLRFIGNASEGDIEYFKYAIDWKLTSIDWKYYFHHEARIFSDVWATYDYNPIWVAKCISVCFPEYTADVYKFVLLIFINNPDKYVLALGTREEMDEEHSCIHKYGYNSHYDYYNDKDNDDDKKLDDTDVLCTECCAGDKCEENTTEATFCYFAKRDFIWTFEKLLEIMSDLNKYLGIEFAIGDYWKDILNTAYNYTDGSTLTFVAEVLERTFHVPNDMIENYIATTTYEKIRDWNVWARISSDDVEKNKKNEHKLCIDILNYDVVPEASFQLVKLLSNPIVFKIVDMENPHIVSSFNV